MTSFDTTQKLIDDLQNISLFKTHLKNYVHATTPGVRNNLITRSFAHIKNVLDMYAHIGQENILLLYNLISSLQDLNVAESTRWQYCTLSGVVCKRTMLLSPDHHVAAVYRSWVFAVWLLTHITSIEKMRKHSKHTSDDDIETEHILVYQKCFTLVIMSLVDAFPRILLRADAVTAHVFRPNKQQKSNVFES